MPTTLDDRVNPNVPASISIDRGFVEVADRLRRVTVQVRNSSGGGSGVIWRPDGLIVTNAHVATAAEQFVVLDDTRKFRATVIALDRRRDLAALKIEATALIAAEVRDAVSLRIGELVLAMGNPAGSIGALAKGILHASPVSGWIQADIRLAPGNSGGPLADAQGKVIGINSMIANGLALAVPSKVVDRFIAGKSRPRLGVTVQPTRIGSMRATGVGLKVVELEPNSAAHLSGVRVGDILTASGGAGFQGVEDLAEAIDAASSTGTLVLDIIRTGIRTMSTVKFALEQFEVA